MLLESLQGRSDKNTKSTDYIFKYNSIVTDSEALIYI